MKTLLLCVAGLVALGISVVGRPAAAQPVAIPLHQALAEGSVEVNVTSIGGATGNTMKLSVRRKIEREVRVSVAPGTVFIAVNGKVQNMTGATIIGKFRVNSHLYDPCDAMLLADGEWHLYLAQAFCLDYKKPPPRAGDKFELAKLDVRTTRILAPPPGLTASQWAYQAAIWMDRDGVSADELRRRYRYSTADLEVAAKLLRHAEQAGIAGLPAHLPPEVRKHLEKVFATNPAVRAEGVQALAKLGREALAAAPIVAANLVGNTPGVSASTTIAIEPGDAARLLGELKLEGVQAWVQALRESAGAAGTVGGPLGRPPFGMPPGGLAPGNIEPAREAIVEGLLAQLKSDRPLLRQQAIAALGRAKSPKTVEALLAALGDADARLRDGAAEALKRLSGKDFGTNAEQWRTWWKDNEKSFGQPATSPPPASPPAPSQPAPTPPTTEPPAANPPGTGREF